MTRVSTDSRRILQNLDQVQDQVTDLNGRLTNATQTTNKIHKWARESNTPIPGLDSLYTQLNGTPPPVVEDETTEVSPLVVNELMGHITEIWPEDPMGSLLDYIQTAKPSLMPVKNSVA